MVASLRTGRLISTVGGTVGGTVGDLVGATVGGGH